MVFYLHDGIIANETPSSRILRGGSGEVDQILLRKNIADIHASSI